MASWLGNFQGAGSSNFKDVQRSSELSISPAGRIRLMPLATIRPQWQNGGSTGGLLFFSRAWVETFLSCFLTILKIVCRDGACSQRPSCTHPFRGASPTEQTMLPLYSPSLSQTRLLIQQTFTETLSAARLPALQGFYLNIALNFGSVCVLWVFYWVLHRQDHLPYSSVCAMHAVPCT